MRYLATLALATILVTAAGPESPTWRQFVDAIRTRAEPILPDFSYAGYHGGVDAIPMIRGSIFDVTRYGAKGDGKADDQAAIVRCIGGG
jgi:hypothetical protein